MTDRKTERIFFYIIVFQAENRADVKDLDESKMAVICSFLCYRVYKTYK